MTESDTLVALVQQIENALAIAMASQVSKLGLVLDKAEIELRVAVKKSAVIGGKFELGVLLEASAGMDETRGHAITLSLIPKTNISLGDRDAEDLAEAIAAVAQAMSSISRAAAPNFNPSEATALIEVELNKEGKLQVITGAGGAGMRSHKIKLTFRPS